MTQRKKVFLYLIWCLVLLVTCKEDAGTQPAPPDRTGEFRNPVLSSAPDPWVFQKDEWYYITHTTGNSVRIYRSKTMSDLSTAEVKTIWTPPSTGMNSKNIWAPEIHFINDKWYVYYAADDGNNENHRMWVLENESGDPFQGTWVDKGKMELPDDKWAIDGTVFEHNSELYFLWSGWEGDVNLRQDLYIAKMTDPLNVEGERILLSKPELTWETQGAPPAINEGGQFLKRGDKMFIVYSASGCWTDNYALGMLVASTTADPLDPDSWIKKSEPVLTSSSSSQTFGPGHNAFFKSPDGTEDWIIYHANNAAGQGCGNARSARIQKFTWTDDGTPVFGNPASLSLYLQRPSGE